MEVKSIQGKQQYLPLPTLECIRVDKVYDWIIQVTQIVNESIIPDECLPLPASFEVECEVTDVFCEEKPGAVRRDVTVVVNGTPVTLQQVTIRKAGTYRVTIFDTTVSPRVVHCTFTDNFTRFEKKLLCAPPGTVITCHIVPFNNNNTEIARCEVLEVVDNTTVNVDIVVCQSIQAEANVKLLIEAEQCAPRPEIAVPIEECPVTFPEQCDPVFPGTSYPYPGQPFPSQ